MGGLIRAGSVGIGVANKFNILDGKASSDTQTRRWRIGFLVAAVGLLFIVLSYFGITPGS